MKTKSTKLFYCVLIALSFAVGKANAQMVYIPDTNFRNWISGNYPGAIVGDSLDITNTGVVNATVLNLSFASIIDLTGVEYFVSATGIDVSQNLLTTLPALPATLTMLDCQQNSITSIPSLPPALVELLCWGNGLTSLPPLPSTLEWMDCHTNMITSLPALPPSLMYLDASINALTSFPSLPLQILEVNVSYNNISSIPSLPSYLEKLNCASNNLSALPALPVTLQILECSVNSITSLPSLPAALQELWCSYNALSSLPSLPATLIDLVCNNNSLTSLPALPLPLNVLICLGNNIATLPTLPDYIYDLNVSSNPILQLPTLPIGLWQLNCQNTLISCLPHLPAGLLYLFATGNGITCLPNLPQGPSFASDIGLMLCPIHYSACDTFPVIKGMVFYDINNNGVYDVTETLAANRLVSLSPNTWNGLTDSVGEFTAVVDTGNYVINVFTYKHDYVTTPIQNANVPNYFDVDTDNVIGLYVPPNINDLEVHLISVNPPRPGFNNQIDIVYANTGSTTLTGSVNFYYDNNYVYDSAAPPQFSQAGNMLTWNFSNLPPYTTETIRTYFYLPPGVPIGTVLTNTVTVYPLNNDSTPADNMDTLAQTVVGSYDPNDKSVEPPAIVTYLGNPLSDILKYTIRFQNTGTFPAENVTIIDTLDARLNPATFHLISSSHLCNVQIYGNLLSFTFSNINLPDSNSNEVNSHGYVQFTINIDSGANLSAPLINNADIYFDFNPPVRTPDAVVQFVPAGVENIDGNTSISIYPVPVHDVLNVSFNKPTPANTIISINDMQGRVVKEETITQSNSSVIPINVSALSQGVYLLRMDGVVKRFVKL